MDIIYTLSIILNVPITLCLILLVLGMFNKIYTLLDR
jgi:hypothetical protein